MRSVPTLRRTGSDDLLIFASAVPQRPICIALLLRFVALLPIAPWAPFCMRDFEIPCFALPCCDVLCIALMCCAVLRYALLLMVSMNGDGEASGGDGIGIKSGQTGRKRTNRSDHKEINRKNAGKTTRKGSRSSQRQKNNNDNNDNNDQMSPFASSTHVGSTDQVLNHGRRWWSQSGRTPSKGSSRSQNSNLKPAT